MSTQTLTPEEISARGRRLYEAELKTELEPEHVGRILVVDVETRDYLIGDDYGPLSRELQSRRPGAPLYAMRIGFSAVGRIGGRLRRSA